MNRADEKTAFQQMMAELSDSDSDADEEKINTLSYSSMAAAPKVYDNPRRESWVISDNGAKNSSQNVEEEIETFGTTSNSQQDIQQIHSEEMQLMKKWLMRPCAAGDPPILCHVDRHRLGFGSLMPNTYKCYLEGQDGQSSRFLMSAKKKTATSKTSYYLISLDKDPRDDRGSDTVLGKVRGNSVGSQYLITDAGLSLEKAQAPSMLRKVSKLSKYVSISF